ncbi:membrane protein [Streptomyces purpureus]|uniref:Membrane protein n=1 Tax=Streptomyces purpureus TaxID=1951 RepID=A0A918H7G3_9ACTN|nr:membrane protein [Streptomyces purpureus]
MNVNSLRGTLMVTLAYVLVGASFTANSVLGDYPYAGGQALRYGAACLLLLPLAGRGALAPLRALTARQWIRLAVLAGVGMVGFNLSILLAERSAEPAVPGVFVGCAPVVVAVLAPLLDGRRPSRPVLYGALFVAAGAFTVQGWGRTDLAGMLWSLGALAGEVGFTVLAVPVLAPLGPRLLTLVVCGLGAVESAVLGLVLDGRGFLRVPTGAETAALVWQAAVVTVVGFVLYYTGMRRIGVERAVLLSGMIPVAAALTAPLAGTGTYGAAQAAGSALVGAGAALGSGVFGKRSAAAVQDDPGDEGGIVVHRHVPAAGEPYESRRGDDVLGADPLTAQEQPVPGAPGDGHRQSGNVVGEPHAPSGGERLVETGGFTQREGLGDDGLR